VAREPYTESLAAMFGSGDRMIGSSGDPTIG